MASEALVKLATKDLQGISPLRKERMGKGQKKQKTSGKLGWRSKKANHGRKPGMGRGKRN